MTSLNRMKKLLASILAVSTCISMLACGVSATDVEFQTNPQTVTVGSETENVDLTTGWRYLDNNTDPAGDSTAEGYDRLSWTKADYDDSSWNVAADLVQSAAPLQTWAADVRPMYC